VTVPRNTRTLNHYVINLNGHTSATTAGKLQPAERLPAIAS